MRLARGAVVAAVAAAVTLTACGPPRSTDRAAAGPPGGTSSIPASPPGSLTATAPPSTAPGVGAAPPSPTAVRRSALPPFRPVVKRVTRAEVRYSYAPGCPVTPAQLRKLRVSYHGFDGQTRRGTLIVASWAVRTVRAAFRAAWRAGFPIRKIHPVERYYRGSRSGMARSDARSMRADNTSAFNCRHATGSSRWSAHSWGDAVDVNPKENPHLYQGRVYPPNGAAYADRGNKRKGMLHASSAMTRTMRARGWTWGGSYNAPDYQHFSRTGA